MNLYSRKRAVVTPSSSAVLPLRPSGRQFSIRLTDSERAILQRAVDLENYAGRYHRVSVGSYIKAAGLAAANKRISEVKAIKPVKVKKKR